MSETNANHAAVLADAAYDYCDGDDERGALKYAAAVLSAPGVVDLNPAHTAEILTQFRYIAHLALAAFDDPSDFNDSMLYQALIDLPPHVREALRANINPPQRRKQ
jgi:hypothetical protein